MRVLRVDEHRDPRARLHPRYVHLCHDLVEDGAVRRAAVLALTRPWTRSTGFFGLLEKPHQLSPIFGPQT